MSQRGFDDEIWQERLLLLSEEVGELIQACRKYGIGHVRDMKEEYEIGEEIVDVINTLFHLANEFDVDVAKVFERKEAKVDERNYRRK